MSWTEVQTEPDLSFMFDLNVCPRYIDAYQFVNMSWTEVQTGPNLTLGGQLEQYVRFYTYLRNICNTDTEWLISSVNWSFQQLTHDSIIPQWLHQIWRNGVHTVLNLNIALVCSILCYIGSRCVQMIHNKLLFMSENYHIYHNYTTP